MIRNLYEELLETAEAADGTRDHRWKKWAKRVDSVDTSKNNGYAFVGEWVEKGTIDEPAQPGLYLTGITRGSNKYQTTTYRFIRMDSDGNLHDTGIVDNDETRGWALRVREQVKSLLADIQNLETANPLADFTTEQLRAELERRGEL